MKILPINPYLKFFLKEIFLPIFLFLFLIPGMVVRVTYVPSGSMTPTILEGDKIILSKLHYGAKTPETLLQLPFFEKSYLKNPRIPFFRLPALKTLQPGDPIVFGFPGDILTDNRDMCQWFVKRVVAIYGQTIKIEKGEIYVNGEKLQLHKRAKLQHRYRVELQNFRYESKEIKYLHKYHQIAHVRPTDTPHTYIIHTTEEKAAQLAQEKEVTTIEKKFEKPSGKKSYFTYEKHFSQCMGGSTDSLPEITVPVKGMTIKINRDNLYTYGHIILHHEGNKNVEIDPEECTLSINGVLQETYTFKLNYFMVKGDNRPDSYDSSAWGFVPETHIVGKPLMILVSNKNNYFLLDLITLQLRWNRFLKVIY